MAMLDKKMEEYHRERSREDRRANAQSTTIKSQVKRTTPRLRGDACRVQRVAESKGYTMVRSGRDSEGEPSFTLYGGDLGPQGFTPDHDALRKILTYLSI